LKKLPVIVLLQGGRDDKSVSYEDVWNHGHYMIIIGEDDINFYL
jgi:hypothetical protein